MQDKLRLIGDTSLRKALDFMEAADLIGRTDVAIEIQANPKRALIVQHGEADVSDILLAQRTLRYPDKRVNMDYNR